MKPILTLKNFIIFSIWVLAVFVGSGTAVWSADEPARTVVTMPEYDPLQQTLKKVETMQAQYQAEHDGLSEEAETVLRTLKNPFIPQIPRKSVAVKDIPTPSPTPAPANTTGIVSAAAVSLPTPTPILTKPDFKIAGLVWNTIRPQAIVNGIIMNVGESVSGWQIKSITKDGILVVNSDFEYWLKP